MVKYILTHPKDDIISHYLLEMNERFLLLCVLDAEDLADNFLEKCNSGRIRYL